MPTYVSHKGEWHPAKEKVGLINRSGKVKTVNGQTVQPGEPFIYEGPDRAALFELYNQGVEKLGQNFKRSPEILDIVRKFNFKDIDDYLQFIGYDEAKADKDFEEKAQLISKHELPKRVKEIDVMSGGGGEYKKGAWDEPPLVK